MSLASSAILFQGFAPSTSAPTFDAVSLSLDTSAVELASTADLPGGDASPPWQVDLVDADTIELTFLGASETGYVSTVSFIGYVFSDATGDLPPIAKVATSLSGLTQAITVRDVESIQVNLAGATVSPGATITLDISFGVDGTGRDDTMTGTAAADYFVADDGDDLLRGKAGADTLFGEAGDDTLKGGGKADLLNGGVGNDVLVGNAGGDVMSGDVGDDVLRGGGGDDQIVGGEGADRLIGGKGADAFRFFSVEEIGNAPGARDEIRDFRPGEDMIDLSAIDARDFSFGDDAFALVRKFSGDGGELRYLRKKGLLLGDTDGDKLADFTLELDAKLSLDEGDFVL